MQVYTFNCDGLDEELQEELIQLAFRNNMGIRIVDGQLDTLDITLYVDNRSITKGLTQATDLLQKFVDAFDIEDTWSYEQA